MTNEAIEADLATALEAYELTKRRAAKCAAAQYKLNELHRRRGEEHRLASAAYEGLRDLFVRQVVAKARGE